MQSPCLPFAGNTEQHESEAVEDSPTGNRRENTLLSSSARPLQIPHCAEEMGQACLLWVEVAVEASMKLKRGDFRSED